VRALARRVCRHYCARTSSSLPPSCCYGCSMLTRQQSLDSYQWIGAPLNSSRRTFEFDMDSRSKAFTKWRHLFLDKQHRHAKQYDRRCTHKGCILLYRLDATHSLLLSRSCLDFASFHSDLLFNGANIRVRFKIQCGEACSGIPGRISKDKRNNKTLEQPTTRWEENMKHTCKL